MTAPRLNPFALPPATTGRFLLLVATGVAASVQVYGWLVARLATVSAAPARCVATARQITGSVRPEQLIDWYAGCEVWASVREARFVVLMVAVFALVSAGIYLAMPAWTRRSLVPLSTSAAEPHLAATVRTVEELVAREAGRRDVRVYLSVAAGRGEDRAFGRLGRYAIALNGSRLAKAAADPGDPELAGVLRHELAHVRNRDIDLTQLTIAVWWGFLGAVVALPLAYVAWQAPESLGSLAWRLGILLVVFWLLRASVLRAREFYADAGSAGGPDLIRTLEASPGPHSGSRFTGWFRFHPYVEARTAVLRDTGRLFSLEPGVAAAVGALVGLGYPPAQYFAALVRPGQVFLPGWICGLTFGSLVAAVLAGATWRAALWAAAEPGRTVRTFPSALAFTAALMGGLLLTPDLPESGSFRRVAEADPPIAAALGLLLLGLTGAFLRWTRFCAECRLPVSGDLRRSYRFGVLQAGLVFGFWLAAWFHIGNTLPGGGTTWAALALLLAAGLIDPFLLISFSWACWYPLATWQSRRPGGGRRGLGLWQDPADERALPGVRTPLAAVHVTAVSVLAAYAGLMVPFYPWLRRLLEVRREDLTTSPFELLPLVLLLLLPALAVTGLGLFALGLAAGGRGRLERAVTAAGAALLPISAGVLMLMLLHVSLASPQSRSLPELLAGLTIPGGPGTSELAVAGGPGASDRPENAALGLMVMVLLGLLLLAGLPPATAGSLMRAVRSAPPPRRPPGRRRWVTAALVVPVLLVGGVIAGLGVSEWRVPEAATVPEAIDPARVEQVLAEPWPMDVPLDEACTMMIRGVSPYLRWQTGSASGGFDVLLTRAAAGARTASDVTLQAIGEGTVEALRRKQLLRARKGVTTAVRYCATALSVQ